VQPREGDDAQIDCAALEGTAFQSLVSCLVEELEQHERLLGATSQQLAAVLREVSERCSDDSPDQQADALSHLLVHAHELLSNVPDGSAEDFALSELDLSAERSPSILPESGVVRRSTLRSPSEPGRSEPGLPGAPDHVHISAADDFDDETEVTMPAITRMNHSVFDIDDDETEHTLPGLAPASTRRNGLRLG
jgi:hypothetical protein